MPTSQNWLQQQWQNWFGHSEDAMVPLDQVSRFYQSEVYLALDEALKSAFYDGPLGGLDARIIERKDIRFIQDCYQLWEHGRNISCAIYGEKGTGLSTLLTIFIQELKQKSKPYEIIQLSQRVSDEQQVITILAKQFGLANKTYKLDEFIESVNALPPCAIIIDNLHFLVQRTLSAQKVVDCLGAIILASRGHHFWLLAGEEQAWRRLCYGYQFENLISHQQHISNFTESEIRNLLVKRFQYAGFHTINDFDLEKSQGSKTPLQDIAKRSKGCVELSLFYCLNHLTHGTTPQSIYLMIPQDIDTSALKKLTQNDLFTLAEMAAHGQLSAKEHSRIFRMEVTQSRMLLEHLRVLGFLDHNDESTQSQAYKLKLIISAVIIRYLISMNYLY